MNFKETTLAIVAAVQATIVTEEAIPLMVWGPPGIGKSAAVLEASKVLASQLKLKGVWQFGDALPKGHKATDYFGLIDLRASQMDPVDAGGFPVRDEENDVMRRVLGSWFPHTGRDDLPTYGLVFCDELSSAAPSVQASLYQFMQDRRLYDRAMKKGWAVVGAGNRMTDGGVTHKMATPLANRLVHIDQTSDLDNYTSWALSSGELPLSMVAFLRFRSDLLNTHETHVKKRVEGHAFATERTWHKLAKLEKFLTGEDTQALWSELASGLVGAGPAAEYLGFKSVWKSMPNIDDIMLNPAKAPVPDDSEPATLFAVVTALAGRACADNMDAIITYMKRLPAPFAVLCLRDATRRDPDCWSAASVIQYVADNTDILN